MDFIDRDLASIQEARILGENAKVTQSILLTFQKEKLDKILDLTYRYITENLYLFSKIYVEESSYGIMDDEYELNKSLLRNLYERLKNEDFTSNDEEIYIPRGGVLLIPSTKIALCSILTTILLCIKTANVLVVATDFRTVNTTKKIVEGLNGTLFNNDYPIDFITCLSNISSEGVKELLKVKCPTVVINAGNKKYIEACKSSGKVFYYGSTGASTVFIERSADIKESVKDITDSRRYNNGILAGAEQFVVVDTPAISEVIEAFKCNKAHIMTTIEENKLISILLKNGVMDKELIGKSAYKLAEIAGFKVEEDTSVLISYHDYISEFNSYHKELNCPVLLIYREDDWLNACEKCIRLLTKEQDGHSLSIYSRDEKVIEQFILKKPVGRVMVNTNTSFSAMGIGSNSYPSSILGAFTRGIGVLSENLKAKDLLYKRKIVRSVKMYDAERNPEITVDDFYSLLEKINNK